MALQQAPGLSNSLLSRSENGTSVLIKRNHLQIISLFFFSLTGRQGDLCVIIEYCPYGNMLQFLRSKRDLYDPKWLTPSTDPDKQFTTTDIVSAAFQVARAMEFLASRKVRQLPRPRTNHMVCLDN